MISLIAVVISFTVVFVVRKQKSGGLSIDSPEFALYKNTIFTECYNNASTFTNTNCTAIKNRLDSNRISGFEDHNVAYINSDKMWEIDNHDISWEWCEMISCFSDYKIVPSKPRSIAVWPTILSIWGPPAGFIIGSIYQYIMQQYDVYKKKKKACKGLKEIGIIDWIVHAYDLGSIIWWWYSFGRLVRNPDTATFPFPMGWVTVWKYAGVVRFHPYSCASRGNPKRIRYIRGALYVLAAVQWIASCYIMNLNWPTYGRRVPSPSYDCVLDQINAAPGTSTCTADQICSRNWLFVDAGFSPNTDLGDRASLSILLLFCALTLAALAPVLLAIVVAIMEPLIRKNGEKDPEDRFKRVLIWADVGPVVSICICSFFAIIVGGMLISQLVSRLNERPYAEVNLDWECKALHVSLSPWRYYVDVEYEKNLRLVKMWFNA